MSCSSPFVYVIDQYYVTVPYKLSFSGNGGIPGYSTPSFELCLLGLNAAHCSWYWTGWQNWKRVCDWHPSSWYWYDCTAIASIQVFPAITVYASATIPMLFRLGVGELISTNGVSGTIAESIVFENFAFTAGVNGNSYTLYIPISVYMTYDSGGEFAVQIPIYTLSDSFEDSGFTYSISVGISALFCADPEPPAGWLNLLFTIEFSVTLDNTSIYTTSFSVDCPLVSVEEEG
jgi:hypothetical protein